MVINSNCLEFGATKERVFSKQHGGLSGVGKVRRRKVLHFLNQGYHFREAYAGDRTQLLATCALTRFKHSCTLSRRRRWYDQFMGWFKWLFFWRNAEECQFLQASETDSPLPRKMRRTELGMPSSEADKESLQPKHLSFKPEAARSSATTGNRAEKTGAPNDRFLGNDLRWLVMHPGVL